MPKRRVNIPGVSLYRSRHDIDDLLAAIADHWDDANAVELDFSRCGFISAEGVAILAAQKLRRDGRGYSTTIDWDSVEPKMRNQFGRWGIASLYGSQDPPWTGNAIPLFHQQTRPYKDPLIAFVSRWVVSGANMPRMTAGLAKQTRQNLCELFGNVFRHADSPIGGLAIGQLYPNERQVQICICDAGVGMARRVQSKGHALNSQVDAIQWALERGHSTWDGKEPPGLGLYTLREFIKQNGGIFRIYANNACFSEESGSSGGVYLRTDFPGTLVELRLQVRDDVTYTLTSTEAKKVSVYENRSA